MKKRISLIIALSIMVGNISSISYSEIGIEKEKDILVDEIGNQIKNENKKNREGLEDTSLEEKLVEEDSDNQNEDYKVKEDEQNMDLEIKSKDEGSVYRNYIEIEDKEELELAVKNADEDMEIVLSENFSNKLDSSIIIEKDNPYNIIITGNNIVLKSKENSMDIRNNSDKGSLIIDGFIFQGESIIDLKNPENNIYKSGSGVSIDNTINGEVTLKNSEFRNIGNNALALSGNGNTKLDNILFEKNNTGGNGGAIYIDSGYTGTIEILNSSFIDNTQDGMSGYTGAGIYTQGMKGNLIIRNTNFRNNKTLQAPGEIAGGSGGAIYYYQAAAGSKLIIEDCLFDGNMTYMGESENNEVSDGGAIALKDIYKDAKVYIKSSTFMNNEAKDDGGAILIQGNNREMFTTIDGISIEDSTFYNNKAYGAGGDSGSSGGAIQIFSAGSRASSTAPKFIGNTFYNNISYSHNDFPEQEGGAISGFTGIFGRRPALGNNIIFGNYIIDKEGNKKHNNISILSRDIGGNIGLETGNIDKDNGLEYDIEDIFGKYPLELNENKSLVCSGYMEDRVVIPTLSIIPRLVKEEKIIVEGEEIIEENIVYGHGENILDEGLNSVDQRARPRYKDAGAVEISSIRYNANGGKFNLEELSVYKGDKYFEPMGEDNIIEDYFQISYIGDRDKILYDDLNIEKGNSNFLGWSTNKNSEEPEDKFKPGKEIVFMEDNIELYAIWENDIDDGEDEEEEDKEIEEKPEINIPEIKDDEVLEESDKDTDLELNREDHIAYIKGYPDNTFRAKDNITRAEFAVMIERLIMDKESLDIKDNEFNDIEASWYTDAINILNSMDIIEGYEDGSFRPDKNITRGELTTIISRFEGLKEEIDSSLEFNDINDSHWAKPYIDRILKKNWIDGYPDKSFRPDDYITREETVRIMNKVLDRVGDKKFIEENIDKSEIYIDLEENWSYIDIIEASLFHEYERKDNIESWVNFVLE